ncbi:hypothetical protein ACRAWF_40840 [Streptomyces sp. L7]
MAGIGGRLSCLERTIPVTITARTTASAVAIMAMVRPPSARSPATTACPTRVSRRCLSTGTGRACVTCRTCFPMYRYSSSPFDHRAGRLLGHRAACEIDDRVTCRAVDRKALCAVDGKALRAVGDQDTWPAGRNLREVPARRGHARHACAEAPAIDSVTSSRSTPNSAPCVSTGVSARIR